MVKTCLLPHIFIKTKLKNIVTQSVHNIAVLGYMVQQM